MPKPKRKPTRGGARPGAGRPKSTGSDSAKPVFFRLSEADRARLDAAAHRAGIGPNELARNATLAELDARRPKSTG